MSEYNSSKGLALTKSKISLQIKEKNKPLKHYTPQNYTPQIILNLNY
ncbi:10352_t:CDS:1 [Gigaspora rosea]|nr:10352_t:CDS:1 [Gigaspora rosea]